MQVDSIYGRLYCNIVGQRIPELVPSEDEDDTANDHEVSYGDVKIVEEIQTIGPMEKIDPSKRAARKRLQLSLNLQEHPIRRTSGAI